MRGFAEVGEVAVDKLGEGTHEEFAILDVEVVNVDKARVVEGRGAVERVDGLSGAVGEADFIDVALEGNRVARVDGHADVEVVFDDPESAEGLSATGALDKEFVFAVFVGEIIQTVGKDEGTVGREGEIGNSAHGKPTNDGGIVDEVGEDTACGVGKDAEAVGL